MTNSTRSSLPVVIFDGDDTLWETERLYDEAREAAKSLVVAVGLDGDAWDALQRKLDFANAKLYGFSKIRFPLSCVEAYEQTTWRAGLSIDHSVATSVRVAAESVFSASADVIPGVVDTLQVVRTQRRLVLLTQGDSDVQWHRIRTSGLEPLFDRIQIVDSKNDDVLRKLLSELGADLASTWLVGNSLRSDINPARQCGVKAIWVDAHVWEYERGELEHTDDGVSKAASISEVASIIFAGERTSDA
jgi:putative hydrolase of the HAD superfamily